MTRAEELAARELDGDLSDVEARELRDLVASNPDARQLYLSTLKVEAALRGALRKPGLAPAVMTRIRRERKLRIVSGAMGLIKSGRTPVRPRPRWPVYATAAAMVVVVGGALFVGRRLVRPPAPALTATAPIARLASAEGAVTVTRASTPRPASAGAALIRGDRVESAAGARATIEYGGATRFVLGGAARLTLDDAPEGDDPERTGRERVLRLDRGTLDVDVHPDVAVLVFATPDARAIVRGTRFTLAVNAGATRLDVQDGSVLFIRLRDGRSTDVGAGQHALSTDAETAPPSAPPATGRGAASPGARTVVAVDFEDPTNSELIVEGYVVAGPPRPGNRGALVAELNQYSGTRTTAKIGYRNRRLLGYSARQAVRFDYWIGADEKGFSVQAYCPERGENLSYEVNRPVREAWASATVRLADLRPQKNPDQPVQEGEPINTIRILGGRITGKPLYIDNLEVLELPSDVPLPPSTARE